MTRAALSVEVTPLIAEIAGLEIIMLDRNAGAAWRLQGRLAVPVAMLESRFLELLKERDDVL